MMAKMFYTLDEARAALGKTEEEIKQYAREGRLREFRDGPRLMFKADQVETLKREIGGSGETVDLGPSDSGAPIGLVDSRSASATGISLADSDAGAGSPMQKEDTALAADLSLSGSVGGMPSPGRGGSHSGSMHGSRSGITVFGADEVEHADPSAQTAISSSVSDQVNLEGVGSGSGLLDLTRESDDTSLGAELLDEIAPGGGKRRAAGTGAPIKGGSSINLGTGTGMALAAGERAGGRILGPQIVEAPDPMAPAFGAMALAGVVMLVIGALAIVAGVVGTKPALVESLAELGGNMGFIATAGIGVVLAIVLFVIGLVMGKVGAR
jgi:hypothetical protein